MTRLERTKNPGNIRLGKTKWKGQIDNPMDIHFCTFSSIQYGYRALWILLNNYYNIRHLYTIRAILMRYAPPNENNTQGYIEKVSKTLSLALPRFTSLGGGDIADMILPPPQEDQVLWTRILIAMTMVEQGIKEEEVDQTAIADGYRMAFGTKEMKN